MKCLAKQLTAFMLSLVVMISLCITVSAATVYDVKVENNSVSFIVNGKNLGSYASRDGSIILSALTDGRFLVCFPNTKGTLSRISIGSQTALEISGTMSSLTLDKTLGSSRKVTLGASSNVKSMRINSTGATTIKGAVGTLTVSGAVDVAVLSGAKITKANLTSSSCSLTAASGSTVNTLSAVSGAKATGSGILKKTSYGGNESTSDDTHSAGDYQVNSLTLTAKSGDRLEDLYSTLNSKLRVYDEDDRRVYGTAEWSSSTSTTVKNNNTYSYTFYPDNDNYDSFKDSVKAIIGGTGTDSDLTSETSIAVDVENIKLSASSARLGDLSEELNDSVEAYNIKNQRVDGTASWVADDSISVVSGKSYRFVFTPDSSKYNTLRKSVKIYLNDSDKDSSSSSKNITLKITSIDADYDDRLSDLEDALEENVRAYNKSDDRVDGEVEWVSSRTTRVTKTGYHSFKFIPDSSKYDTVKDEVKIIVDGDSGSNNNSGSSKVTLRSSESRLYADYNDRLSEYLSELEDSIRAVDDNGDTVCGTLSWVDSGTTRLTRSKSYEFKFVPTKSKYKTAYSDIRIEVED